MTLDDFAALHLLSLLLDALASLRDVLEDDADSFCAPI